MNKIWAIAQAEFYGYFKTPLAYMISFIIVTIFNVFFFLLIDHNHEASLRDLFQVMEFLFVFLIPLITMKSFAEEKAMGRMEFLLTTPTSCLQIIFGKYLGCLAFFSLITLTIPFYTIILCSFSKPDLGPILTGYIGVWLEGAFFISIGIMTSSWTKNQIIASISAYFFTFSLYFCITFTKYLSGPINTLAQQIATSTHVLHMARGIISLNDISYYITGIIFCLCITFITLKKKM